MTEFERHVRYLKRYIAEERELVHQSRVKDHLKISPVFRSDCEITERQLRAYFDILREYRSPYTARVVDNFLTRVARETSHKDALIAYLSRRPDLLSLHDVLIKEAPNAASAFPKATASSHASPKATASDEIAVSSSSVHHFRLHRPSRIVVNLNNDGSYCLGEQKQDLGFRGVM